eukprot:s1122_g3.t1
MNILRIEVEGSGLPCYSAVEDWKGTLQCPRGTISTIGSQSPEDCIQQGELIAVTNIYRCYPPVEMRPCSEGKWPADYVCDMAVEVLCNITEPLEFEKYDTDYKKSFVWGSKIDPTDPESKTVAFYGFDPFEDEDLVNKRPFHSFELQPMDIAVLDFSFDRISKTTLVNAGEAGHFNIHIHSTLLDPNDPVQQARGHLLPPFFWRSINTRLHVHTQLKIIALEQFSMSVQLDLLHGGHVQNLDTFNEVLDIHRYSPSRADWGKRFFFCPVISKEALLDGFYELPYNMPPGFASAVGNPGLAIGLTKLGGNLENQPQTEQYDGNNALAAVDKGGQAFWQSQGLETVPMPWLPFFSNCVGFDSYIILWDLFESPGELRDGCEMVPRDEVKIVPPLIVDFDTLEPRFDPVADSCELITKCHFEEYIVPDSYGSTLWWELPEETVLFYITTQPISYEDFKIGDPFFAPMVGTELLTGVNLAMDDRSDPDGGPNAPSLRIPRRVIFEMAYFQESQDKKKLVSADMLLQSFDNDDTDTVYYLMLAFEALGWQDLMNEFQLPYHVYGILYCLIGLGAVGATLVAWAGIRLKVRKANQPPFRLLECYEFMFWWPVQGVTFATLPVVFACGFIKLLLAPEFNFTGAIPCTYGELASAQTDEGESERCRQGRTGTCFLLAGMLMLVSGSRLIIPRLREVEEQFLLQQPTHLLSREGLTLRAEQRQQIRTVPIRWKRAHLIFVSVFLVFPLTLLWEFTYCDFFGENALYFIIGFSFAMNFVDNALSRAVREELIQVPLSTACSVVLFVGTLGADDFVDFCEGFFLELLYGIAERLILGTLFEAIEKGLAYAAHWAKTRSWFWRFTLILTAGRSTRALLMNEGKDEEEISPEEMVQEGTPIEEAMEEVIGCGTTCMSTIMTPFIIGAIYVFAPETEIPVSYDIRSRDLICYLLFGIIIAPFQVMMDILMNHATELQNNVRIYDYMLYSKWRWRNRVTRSELRSWDAGDMLVTWVWDAARRKVAAAKPQRAGAVNRAPLASLADITNIQDARDMRKKPLREPLAPLAPLAPLGERNGLVTLRHREPSPTPMEISNPELVAEAHDKVQSVAEYAPEIADQLFHDEAIFMPRADYMEPPSLQNRWLKRRLLILQESGRNRQEEGQQDINGKMRAILVDWLVEVHMKYRLRPETLFLAVNLIDRYMSLLPVLRRRLQLLGVVAMFVAAKFEEIDPPKATDFVYITDNTYSKEELFQMECNMLSTLEFQVVAPTAAHFVNQFVKANSCENPRHAEVIKYIMELALLDLRMIRPWADGKVLHRHRPSHLVAAAVLLSNELFGRAMPWPEHMVQISRHTDAELRVCCEELRQLVRQAPSQQLQAVRKKYMLAQHYQVARNAVLVSHEDAMQMMCCWLFDDPRLDQSIAEPLQSVNHLAFSPQFYFIETYYTWGMLVLLLSITVFLRKHLNPMDDPALFVLVGQMFLLNYLLDRMIRWLTSSVLWKPMDNNNFRIFSRSVALALQRKDAALAQEKYRQWFWQRHSGWLVGHLNDIFTPRSRERYKGKLSLLYQQALQLQPTRVYKTPGDAFPEPVGQQELPDNLRLELEEDDSEDEASSLALPGKSGFGTLMLPGVTSKQEPSQGRQGMRASVALRQLDIPSLPTMPQAALEPIAPPPLELEDNWPLQAHGDALELPDAAGFGPLAALTGAAWLRVARRRIIMGRQAEEYTIEQPLNDVCGCCAVRANDPFVKERVGIWQHGPRFKVYLTGNLRQLMTSFERHYDVPPMPFIPSQWQNWLDRHNTYQTLCVRCALEKGLDPPEAGTPPQTPLAIQQPQTPLTLRDQDGASTGSEEEEALMLQDQTPKDDKDGSDIELDPAETTRFPNLVNVQVPQAAREMIIYWAKQARKRVKRRRTIRYQPSSSEEESDEDEEEEEEDTPSEAD